MTDDSQPVAESAVRAARDLVVVLSRLRRQLREVAAADDLTASQTSVLSRLAKEGPASTSTLAAAERVRPQSMAATLAALDERGMLHRESDPDDGRRQLITLTPAAAELVEGTRRARQDWLVQALHARFSEQERVTIITALDLLERVTGS